MDYIMDYSSYFPLGEYYRRVVFPLGSRFRVSKRGMYVCCLHDDHDPSLGILRSKKGGEVFHCFGCNAWGNVIDLHKKVSLKYFGRVLDDELCRRELCSIFGIEYSSLPALGVSSSVDNTDRSIRREMALRESLDRYSVADFRADIIAGKVGGRGIDYFNSSLVRLIDSFKSDS